MMLFLGAGASQPFGIRTMKEMSEEFENSIDLTKDYFRSQRENHRRNKYLYNHGSASFSTAELVSLLSYSYGDLYEEIPHLGRWKEGKWFELPRKQMETYWSLTLP